MIRFTLKLSLALALTALLAVGVRQVSDLSRRIERIERHLGGAKRLDCNERDTIERVRRSVVRVVGGQSEGSGFAVKRGGLILTNFHVIDSEPNPKVIYADNTFETARVVMADKDADLAVIQTSKELEPLRLARPGAVSPAEQLYAVGYPLGGELPGESSIARGSFSRMARDKTNGVEYLQTDMTMVAGISGGPMVNVCGEVVGVNTSGLLLGGMGIAIGAESVREKWRSMAQSEDPLKDVQKVTYRPNESALQAVKAFYNYLKARKLEKAFELLSDHFVRGYSYEQWSQGYRPNLDTSIVFIKPDPAVADRVNVKLTTKDLIGDEIVYKYFEGYWDVRQVDGRWLLWNPRMREVKEPDLFWLIDEGFRRAIDEFRKTREDVHEYQGDMYLLWLEDGNEKLSMDELYRRAKAQAQAPREAPGARA